jgi:uncharacterized membrane protein YidH (DUF202 family)
MPFGRLLIVLGLILLVAGLLLTYTNVFSILRLGKLPGDISIKRENFSFYFPIATCILVSAVLTLIFYILRR